MTLKQTTMVKVELQRNAIEILKQRGINPNHQDYYIELRSETNRLLNVLLKDV